MSNVNRSETVTRKVKTQFGSMYIHMSVDDIGRPLGASISSPGKEPDSQISKLIDQLSINLDYLCASINLDVMNLHDSDIEQLKAGKTALIWGSREKNHDG